MKKTRQFAILLALSLILAGCEQTGPSPYGVNDAGRSAEYANLTTMLIIATDAQSYAPGAPVTLRLTNRTGLRMSHNLCRASLDRWIDDDWRQVQATLGQACTAELRSLAPGQTATFSFRTDRQMRRGQYRIRTELTDPRNGMPVYAYSNSFKLEGNDSD